jgi:hypothetical protein
MEGSSPHKSLTHPQVKEYYAINHKRGHKIVADIEQFKDQIPSLMSNTSLFIPYSTAWFVPMRFFKGGLE